jgi:glyoxylase-like metal-dependent hydrolase (beta-lactamase superfamily II)
VSGTQWRIGDVLITKVVESESTIPAGGPALPKATAEEIRAIPWLRPNTTLVDGEWQPTFPNAKYYFIREEYEYWRSEAEVQASESRYSPWAQSMIDGTAVYADSIKPIADAGLISFVTNDAVISPEIKLMPTVGHTPGHASVVIESGGERAVVTGDLFHFPCQIARPDWSASLDHDQEASAVTRRTFLSELADTQTLVLGTHFAHPTAGHIVSDGGSFRFVS